MKLPGLWLDHFLDGSNLRGTVPSCHSLRFGGSGYRCSGARMGVSGWRWREGQLRGEEEGQAGWWGYSCLNASRPRSLGLHIPPSVAIRTTLYKGAGTVVLLWSRAQSLFTCTYHSLSIRDQAATLGGAYDWLGQRRPSTFMYVWLPKMICSALNDGNFFSECFKLGNSIASQT